MKKVIRLTESDLIKLVKKIINEQNDNINEISPETFKSAIDVSKKRDLNQRTYKLGQSYFNKFIGKELMGGKITDIGVHAPSQGSYRDVSIEVTKDVPQDNGDTKTKKEYIYYDIDKDTYNDVNDKIDRKDAVFLSKIAQHINPNTKYKKTGIHFNIKGW